MESEEAAMDPLDPLDPDPLDPTDKPIGYWLKHLDALIEAQFDAALAAFDIDRRQWQVLNSLSRGPLTPAAVEEALAPFWNKSAGLSEVLAGPSGLVAQGWVRETSGPASDELTLTDEGVASHAAVAEHVEAMRGAILDGITTEQYVETVRNLATMAANLEAAIGEAGQPKTQP
jgi:DNA-binding MarR family transcriptional regulator